MPKFAPNLASRPARTAAPTTAPSPSPPAAQLPPPSEPTWLIGPALKAANEHAFATQRAKKAADRAKAKAPPRKAPATGRSSSAAAAAASIATASSPARGAVAAGTMTSIWAEVWDARKMSAEDLDWPELPTPLSSLSQRYWSPSPSPAAECALLRPTQDREVPLSALVRPVKPRGVKTKGASQPSPSFFKKTPC
ncbi:hypothetical protein BC826DRAFT_966866 [Russula brevipes]|nr:hypothetical protein BC826DRAFT_966866 [Russula brevipes]